MLVIDFTQAINYEKGIGKAKLYKHLEDKDAIEKSSNDMKMVNDDIITSDSGREEYKECRHIFR